MIRHLLKKYNVMYNRTKERALDLLEEGELGDTPTEVANQSDVV